MKKLLFTSLAALAQARVIPLPRGRVLLRVKHCHVLKLFKNNFKLEYDLKTVRYLPDPRRAGLV